MNNLQKLASLISGYAGLDFPGAQDDGYYTASNKIDYLQRVAFDGEHGLDPISRAEAEAVMRFLDDEEMTQNDRYYAFKQLGQ